MKSKFLAARTPPKKTPGKVWDRVSSSQIKLYRICPRRWWATYMGGRPVETSPAMASGTITHAYLEHYCDEGSKATMDDIMDMPGNYQPPSDAVALLNEDELEWAEAAANHLIDEYPRLFEGEWTSEVNVEDWEIEVEGVRCGGYIDRLNVKTRTVRDWKTRKSFRYIPTTSEDFRSDPQLAYYAALCWKKYGGSWTVEHVNVLRGPKPRVAIRAGVLPEWYLEEVYNYFTQDLIPEMKACSERMEFEETEQDLEGCYVYQKPCPFIQFCPIEKKGFFRYAKENKLKILSDQAPPSEPAVPYAQKTLKVLPMNITMIESAMSVGLETMEDVDRWLAEGNTWTDLKGVGDKSAAKIAEVHASLKESK